MRTLVVDTFDAVAVRLCQLDVNRFFNPNSDRFAYRNVEFIPIKLDSKVMWGSNDLFLLLINF